MKMHKLSIVILLILYFANVAAAESEYWYPPKHPDDFDLASEEMAKRSVIKIVSEWQEGKVDVGTGIMLGYEENALFFLTASHVIFDSDIGTADSIEVRFLGELVKFRYASVYKYDERKDVGVIILRNFFEEEHLNKIVKLPIDLKFNFNGFSQVKSLGHPNDREWYITRGNTKPINSVLQMGIEPKLTQNGNSGGPVLSSDNKMIGMVIEGEGEQQGYAIKMEAVFQILNDWNIPYRTRIVGDINRNIEFIRRAAWEEELERLKGQPLPIVHGTKMWQAKYSISGNGNARIFEQYDKTSYIEYLGYYGSSATLDEAWRLWTREISSAIFQDEKYYVKEKGRYDIHFFKYYKDRWLAKLSAPKISFEIIEEYGDLYLVVYDFENNVIPDLVGLLRTYFKAQ